MAGIQYRSNIWGCLLVMRTRKCLKLSRVALNLSQEDLAVVVGVSQQTIAKWERGTTTPSHFSHLRLLENALDQPADMLFPDIFEAQKAVND